MSAKAKNCIVCCIDFRIQQAFYDWLNKTHNLGTSDIIELAGSTRDLVKPHKKQDQEELLRNIGVSVALHNPDNIILIDHQDCSGYAKDNTIPRGLSLEKDFAQHRIFSGLALEMLKKLFPRKKIYSYYITLEHKIIQIF